MDVPGHVDRPARDQLSSNIVNYVGGSIFNGPNDYILKHGRL